MGRKDREGREQLDLFGAALAEAGRPFEADEAPARPGDPDPRSLDTDALIAALPDARLARAEAIAAEAGRRRLEAALPALERLARRFIAFGRARRVPEQEAVMAALGAIGGVASARLAARLIAERVVEGPSLGPALEVAADLGAVLPEPRVLALIEDSDPSLRLAACRLAAPGAALLPHLLARLDDADERVRFAAAKALGRHGRREALPLLKARLGGAPDAEVIDAVAFVADEDAIILLGRIARERSALRAAAIEALELIDHDRARQILKSLGAAGEEGFA